MPATSSSEKTLQREAAMARVADLCTADEEKAGPCPDPLVWQQLVQQGEGLVAHKELLHHMARCSACRVLYLRLEAARQTTAHLGPQSPESPAPPDSPDSPDSLAPETSPAEHADKAKAPAPRLRWRHAWAAACLLCVIGTVLTVVNTPSPTRLSMQMVQTQIREAPRARSAAPLPWAGFSPPPLLTPHWRAYAAGLWQAQNEADGAAAFPAEWLPVDAASPAQWFDQQPAAYGEGYAVQAVRVLCEGRLHLMSGSRDALHQLAVTLGRPPEQADDSLLPMLMAPWSPTSCPELLKAAQISHERFHKALITGTTP